MYPEYIVSEYHRREYDEAQEDAEDITYKYADNGSKWHCERCGVSYEVRTVPDKCCEHCGDRLEKL